MDCREALIEALIEKVGDEVVDFVLQLLADMREGSINLKSILVKCGDGSKSPLLTIGLRNEDLLTIDESELDGVPTWAITLCGAYRHQGIHHLRQMTGDLLESIAPEQAEDFFAGMSDVEVEEHYAAVEAAANESEIEYLRYGEG